MRLVERVHELLGKILKDGDIAVDATAGNGWDTIFLASKVGSTWWVHTFDIQETALEVTKKLLHSRGLAERAKLHHLCHGRMLETLEHDLHEKVAAITFNLGYLPRGDNAITTKTETTIAALQMAPKLLRPEGIITVVAYRQHMGGWEECEAVLRELGRSDMELTTEGDTSHDATSPLLLISKKV